MPSHLTIIETAAANNKNFEKNRRRKLKHGVIKAKGPQVVVSYVIQEINVNCVSCCANVFLICLNASSNHIHQTSMWSNFKSLRSYIDIDYEIE